MVLPSGTTNRSTEGLSTCGDFPSSFVAAAAAVAAAVAAVAYADDTDWLNVVSFLSSDRRIEPNCPIRSFSRTEEGDRGVLG